MEIKLIATSNTKNFASKAELDTFGGHSAGVCYMQSTFEEICAEAPEKTAKRIKMTKENGHHSVYGHTYITLYLHNIPRVIEAIVTNERDYASSIKSGRYTVHKVSEREQILYEKWVTRFKTLIKDTYQDKYPKFFTDFRVEKLAMENARYLTSCFTLISMMYTVSYRQLNYLYGFIKKFVESKTTNAFFLKLKPYLVEFMEQIELTGFVDEHLVDTGKNRVLSIFNDCKPVEYFGDVYVTSYTGTLSYYLHANKHRTVKYWLAQPKGVMKFYVPEILKSNKEFVKEWLTDCESLKDLFPQAMLFNITELSNMDDLKLKIIERKCAVVFLETNQQICALIKKYHKALVDSKHPRAKEMEIYLKGSRCTFPEYKCPHPCGFTEAINEKRKI